MSTYHSLAAAHAAHGHLAASVAAVVVAVVVAAVVVIVFKVIVRVLSPRKPAKRTTPYARRG
jgi:hypothetical protein